MAERAEEAAGQGARGAPRRKVVLGAGLAAAAAAVLLLPVAAAWVLFNGPIEGPILLTFTADHGLTVSDLLAVVAVLVALVALLRGD
jgi:hypothetical protein